MEVGETGPKLIQNKPKGCVIVAIPQNVILDGKIIDKKDLVSPLAFSAKEDKQFKALVEEIKKYIPGFEATDLEVKLAYQADTKTATKEVAQTELFVLRNKAGNVAINVLTFNINNEITVSRTARVDTGAEDNNLLGFEVEGELVIKKYEQDGEIPEFKTPKLPHNPEYVPGTTVTAKLDWVDGRFCLEDEANNKMYEHCGPGCGAFSGSIAGSGGTPINGIDSCCRAHDRCWSVYGKGDNCCDKQIASCIDPYQDQDFYSWFQINSYFQPQGVFC